VKKSLGDVEEEIGDISKAVSKLGSSKVDIKKELKPLKKGFEDLKDKIDDAKKSRSKISEKVSDVADEVEDLELVKKAIKKVATKKDLKGAEDSLKDEVKSAKDLNRKGINAVGKVTYKNQKYLKAIYSDLHGR